MALADTLSRQDHVDTTQDNQETSICPEPMIIQALDLALAQKIWSFTQSDHLVLQTLEALKLGSPLFPCSSKDDWHMTNGHLYFKGHMYIHICNRPLPAPYITLLPLGMQDIFKPRPCWKGTSGGQASPCLSMPSYLGAPYASKTKSTIIPLAPHLPPLLHPLPCPSNNFQLTWSWTFLLPTNMTHWWSWSTMALQRG